MPHVVRRFSFLAGHGSRRFKSERMLLSIHIFLVSRVAHSHGVAQTTREAGGDRRLRSMLLAATSPQHWTLPSADDEGPRYVVPHA